MIIPIRFSPQAPFYALIIPVPIGHFSNKNVWGTWSGGQPVETHVYNRNTCSYFPKLFPFLFLCPLCWIIRRVTAVHSFPDSRSQFPVSRCPLPVARCPLPVPLPHFSNIRINGVVVRGGGGSTLFGQSILVLTHREPEHFISNKNKCTVI